MRNHGEKIKDMSRSVLPSKGRKGARDDRTIIHGRQRARELAAVTAYRRDADPESVTPDVRGTYAPDITYMVRGRRARDKVGPLIRWAEATIAADPVLRSATWSTPSRRLARMERPWLGSGRLDLLPHSGWKGRRHGTIPEVTAG